MDYPRTAATMRSAQTRQRAATLTAWQNAVATCSTSSPSFTTRSTVLPRFSKNTGTAIRSAPMATTHKANTTRTPMRRAISQSNRKVPYDLTLRLTSQTLCEMAAARTVSCGQVARVRPLPLYTCVIKWAGGLDASLRCRGVPGIPPWGRRSSRNCVACMCRRPSQQRCCAAHWFACMVPS
jgi:hypothetical protein